MISYNGITYIGYDEIWKPIKYKDIVIDMYEVSNLGRFKRLRDGKILTGNNIKNERGGYCRIALKTTCGKSKKFQMHRIVLYTFDYLDEKCEVNHINGNKRDNSIFNLENSTRMENARHAAQNNLYQSCEDHYRANFTNTEVEMICKQLEDGQPISKIISSLHLENRGDIYSNIDKIIKGKAWKKISSKYHFDYNKYHYKTYEYEDILKMCECIFTKQMKNAEIVKLFPQYNTKNLKVALKSIRAHRLYKSVINEYLSSTTIENIT